MLIDTHAHLDFSRFNGDRDQVINDAYQAGIKKIINVGADMESSLNSAKLAKQYDFIYACVGVHPHEAKTVTDKDYQVLKKLANDEKVIGIGEIGLDYHYDNSPREIQREVFKKQLKLAKEVELPIAIHSRDANQDTMNILKDKAQNLTGVMHCYAYDLKTAKEVIDLGFYLAFGGVITFNGASDLRKVVKEIPLNRILIETDAPYLTPEPHRGKRNEPKFVSHIAERIAKIKGVSLKKVEEQTTENTKQLFNLI